MFRNSPTFSGTWIFFLLRLSLLLFSSLLFCATSAFHLSILSEVWLLNFFRLTNPHTLTDTNIAKQYQKMSHMSHDTLVPVVPHKAVAEVSKLDDGWPESEKDVFQAALRMVVVKDSRWMVGEFYMSYGGIRCEKVRLIKKRILGKGHQMTRVLQPQRERGKRGRERERERERRKGE